MGPVPGVWEFFVAFPVELATQVRDVVFVVSVVMAIVLVARRGTTRMATWTQWMPLAICGFAWLLSSIAGWTNWGPGGYWVAFSLLMLTSFIWSLINLIRALINK